MAANKEKIVIDEADLKGSEPVQIETLGSNDHQDDIPPSVEKRITRKFDLHIMPWLFLMWYVLPVVSPTCVSTLILASGSSIPSTEQISETPLLPVSPSN